MSSRPWPRRPALAARHRRVHEHRSESYQAAAVIAQGGDRNRLYGLIAAQVPAFSEYEKSTDRTFPVVVLEGVPVPA
jgi:F420H(2)-dependent quinone reductase